MIDVNSINLNLLRFFIVTAESTSIAEAGEKLGYSHSTVSANISTLEKQFGVKLFARKPLKLTDVGKEIYETVKRGFMDIDFAMLIADSKNDIECGNLSIGCPSHIVEFYLMERIAEATKDYPNLKINLDTSYECENLIEAVKENKIDFAVLDRIPSQYEKDIEVKEIKRSDYIFVANEKITINDIKELENYKYVLAGEQRSNTIKLSKILKQYDVELDVRLRCRTNRAKNKCS
ncbi:LysR family transcriptional regulator [uncultured Clostridium sp.]|uniref:LysR family transcriptional regulator n=1 Tax=uncultured Clostridium sp. TaxID=59620 RepID=UPI0026330D03|nr:LysR family transcriptional regulator [uncultured Clostridium sp.]MCI8310105.1 LysR family transcriptional regulator [Clostridia bacterium]